MGGLALGLVWLTTNGCGGNGSVPPFDSGADTDVDTEVSSLSAFELAPNDAIAADQLRG